MLRPFAHPVVCCWMLLRVVAQILKPVKRVVSFSRRTAGSIIVGSSCILFAHYCQHARNNSQHCWRNNVGSCCVRLHAALDMNAFVSRKHAKRTSFIKPELSILWEVICNHYLTLICFSVYFSWQPHLTMSYHVTSVLDCEQSLRKGKPN